MHQSHRVISLKKNGHPNLEIFQKKRRMLSAVVLNFWSKKKVMKQTVKATLRTVRPGRMVSITQVLVICFASQIINEQNGS